MSAVFKQVIENIENLSSLEVKHDVSVDQVWGELTQRRFTELESGSVKGATWNEIKSKVKQ